ncbi:hypothetical protein DRQ11_01985 [candidate division KSB1 bacterium]|nr:MAG: hypothetical protein DRQ11_01985 [candidate division KSB1 bacterium]
MKIKYLLSGTAVFLWVLTFNTAYGQLMAYEAETDSIIGQGIRLLHEEYFDQSLATFQQVIERYPNSPMGYFYAAAVYLFISENYRVVAPEAKFDSLCNIAIKKGEHAIRRNPEDAFSRLYLGGTYGFRGVHKARKRQWLQAFRDGWRGITNLKAAAEIDPQLWDVYYGLGLYHYWRSAKAGILKSLRLIKDERQRGINEIWTAIKKGHYSEIEGKYALVYIYYNEQNYEKALQLNQELYQRFPTDPACLYMRARLFQRLSRWEEMKKTFEKLLACILNSKYKTIGYQVECHYGIAYALKKMGKFSQALEECKKAMALIKKRDPSRELEGPLENFSDIVRMTKNLCDELQKLTSGG